LGATWDYDKGEWVGGSGKPKPPGAKKPAPKKPAAKSPKKPARARVNIDVVAPSTRHVLYAGREEVAG